MKLIEFYTSKDLPWAITDEALRGMLDIYWAVEDRKAVGLPLDIATVEAELGRPLDNTHTLTMRDGGVAVLPVRGPIFRYADRFTQISGGTTVQSLREDFQHALTDSSVNAIVLHIDSPGGEANGVNEFADMVYAARARKPVVAYVSHQGASAAYWIASAASAIVVDASAMVGSIGVRAAVRDPSKERSRDIEFISSQSPHKRPNPTTEQGRTQLQALVDNLADVFIAAVARNRDVTAQTVTEKFGGGGVLVGAKAVSVGMADRIGSFDGIVTELAAGRIPTPRQLTAPARTGVARRAAPREDRMSGMNPLRPEFWAALFSGAQMAQEQDGTLLQGTVVDDQGKETPMTARQNAGLESVQLSAQSGPSEREKQLEAELAQARQQAASERKERIATAAEAFADAQVAASRALPAERDHLARLFARAAEDDAMSPLAAGEGEAASRVALLKATIEARTTHGLTEETIPAGELVALSNQTAMPDDAKAMAEQARAEARAWAERQNGPKPAA